MLRTAPLLFPPAENRALFFASNVLWKTTTADRRGRRSVLISRATRGAPAPVGVYRDTPAASFSRRGVIYAVAPSSLDPNVIWAGTDDG